MDCQEARKGGKLPHTETIGPSCSSSRIFTLRRGTDGSGDAKKPAFGLQFWRLTTTR